MKKIQYIFIMSLVLLGLASCNKDGDFLTTSGNGDILVDGNVSDIVLKYENAKALALTVYWTENGNISLSNPLVSAPINATINTIQFSASEDFKNVVENQMNGGIFEKQYTVFELNAVVSKLNFVGNVLAPLYIRVKYLLGANMSARYSEIMRVNVSPYVIDMSKGYILNSKLEESGNYLFTPTSDGVYKGFMGAGAWSNFYLREGDGTTWGNLGEDGKEFYISKEDTRWNLWFPGISGCYYSIVDTKKLEWSALYISELSVSGDLSGAMTYNRQENKWTYEFNATESGTISVKIAGKGKQYNVSTSTNDAAAIDKTVGFSGSSDNVSFGESASAFTVAIEKAGTVSLILDLNKSDKITCTVGGGSKPVEVSKFLWMSGLKSWDFESYLRLYNEDEKSYGGAGDVNSEFGYKFYTEKDNWDSAYGMVAGGTATSGKLVAAGPDNVTAPAAGLYLFDVSMKALTYNIVPIKSVEYSGINDDWNTLMAMTATATPGEFTAAITINKPSQWGFKIYVNNSWDYWFGGSNGELFLKGNGITDDATLAAGNYTLRVNLCKGVYSLTK